MVNLDRSILAPTRRNDRFVADSWDQGIFYKESRLCPLNKMLINYRPVSTNSKRLHYDENRCTSSVVLLLTRVERSNPTSRKADARRRHS